MAHYLGLPQGWKKMKKLENGPNFECWLKMLNFMEYQIGGCLRHLKVRRIAVHSMCKLLGSW